MTVLLVIAVLAVVFWILYGRGAWIVYQHKKDEWMPLPEGCADKDSVMGVLKKELAYQDAKDIYFDENGEICISGKYDSYCVHVIDGQFCVGLLNPNDFSSEGCGKTTSFLIKCARIGSLFDRKNAKRIEELECIGAYVVKIFNHNAPVNAHKKYVNMKRARKHSGWMSLALVVLAVVLVVATLSKANDPSEAIRQSYFEEYSTSVTIGDAFEDFFNNPTWRSYEENGKDYVEFKGGCTWFDEPADMKIIFEMDGEWFYIDEVILYADNTRIETLDQGYLLKTIYDSYGE